MADENKKSITFEEFFEGLIKERDLYIAMDGLSAVQIEMLEKSDVEKALGLMKEKAGLVGAFEALELHLAPWKSAWQEKRSKIETDKRGKVEAVLGEIANVLKTLIEKENRIQDFICRQKKDAVSKILDGQKHKAAGNAYLKQDKGKGESRFFDGRQ